MKDDQRVALTKRLLQEGLLRLLEKKDIDSIHVSELCAESGINRATFYRHYNEPRDILRNMRQNMIRDVKAFARTDKMGKNLQISREGLCQYVYDQAELLRILFKTRTDDEFVESLQALYKEQFAPLRYKSIKNQDEDSQKLMAYCYAGGFYYILRQWILEPIHKTPTEVADIMYRFLNGK